MSKRSFSCLAAVAMTAALVVTGTATTAAAADTTCQTSNSTITNYSYVLKGLDGSTRTVPDLTGNTRPGDQVTASFTIVNCSDVQVSLATYRAPTNVFSEVLASQQTLYDSDTGTFSTGRHSLQVTIPAHPGTPSGDCTNTHLSTANFTGHGANVSGPYDTTCDGSPSRNGNTQNSQAKQPCAGCVGNADNKNPAGQLPNAANDGNKGYECDNNQGVGKTNPAHSGCAKNRFYQIDLARGPVLPTLGPAGSTNFYAAQGRLLDTDLG
jgi:hypothetical protein